MIGAVVGVQPFGGEGLSGTGPKAGGPHALLRYALERAVSVNIAAQGGDRALLSLNLRSERQVRLEGGPALTAFRASWKASGGSCPPE
jgi:delta 1-pyrroline-5-carboxylate dehydrogenase